MSMMMICDDVMMLCDMFYMKMLNAIVCDMLSFCFVVNCDY